VYVTPVITSLSASMEVNNQFSFGYSANPGLRYVVESSSNLFNWTAFGHECRDGDPAFLPMASRRARIFIEWDDCLTADEIRLATSPNRRTFLKLSLIPGARRFASDPLRQGIHVPRTTGPLFDCRKNIVPMEYIWFRSLYPSERKCFSRPNYRPPIQKLISRSRKLSEKTKRKNEKQVSVISAILSVVATLTASADQKTEVNGAVFTMNNSSSEKSSARIPSGCERALTFATQVATGGRGTGAGLGSQGGLVLSDVTGGFSP